MFHQQFINYRKAETNSQLNAIQELEHQYSEQLTILKQTLSEYQDLVHQKYDLTDPEVKEFFDAKNELIKK